MPHPFGPSSHIAGKVSVFQGQNLISDGQTLQFFFVLSHLTAIESPQRLKRASQQACRVWRTGSLSSFVFLCACLSCQTSGKQCGCRLLPAGLCIYIIVLAATFLFFFFFFPRRGKRATFGLSQGQVMISDSVSPKHMACPGKLSQFPKIW